MDFKYTKPRDSCLLKMDRVVPFVGLSVVLIETLLECAPKCQGCVELTLLEGMRYCSCYSSPHEQESNPLC